MSSKLVIVSASTVEALEKLRRDGDDLDATISLLIRWAEEGIMETAIGLFKNYQPKSVAQAREKKLI